MGHSHNYKGGSIASTGYKLVFVGKGHHLADVRGYVYEHRLKAEAKLGRRLKKGEQVHHVDRNKLNNEPENLEVLTQRAHRLHHRKKKGSKLRMPEEENVEIECKCGCGGKFLKYDYDGRPRMYIWGHIALCQKSPLKDFIIDEISKGNNTTDGLLEVYGKPSIKSELSNMVKIGKIIRVGRGVYQLPVKERQDA